MKKVVIWAFIVLVMVSVFAALMGATSAHAAETGTKYNIKLGASNLCSLTNPEYMLQHTAPVYFTGATTKFQAWVAHPGQWSDAYWTTGEGSGDYSGQCNARMTPSGYHKSLGSDSPLSTKYTSTLSTVKSSNFSGDIGWDIWLEPSGTGSTNLDMASGGAAHTELMIVIKGGGSKKTACKVHLDGHCWNIVKQKLPSGYEGHKGTKGVSWSRDYVELSGAGSSKVSDLNLTTIATSAVLSIPKSDHWQAIDGGAELNKGRFWVTGYSLAG